MAELRSGKRQLALETKKHRNLHSRRITEMRTAQGEPVMSIKAISKLRSAALLGVAVGAFAVLAPAASMAQLVPRADFPGAKQAENPAGKAKKSTSKASTSKTHAQHMRGKHHHAS